MGTTETIAGLGLALLLGSVAAAQERAAEAVKPRYAFPEFTIIAYADFPNDENHKVAMAKYTLNKGFNCVEAEMDAVDACRKAGLKVRVGSISIAKLLEHAPKYRGDPTILGYFISDRRSRGSYPGFAAIAREFEKADPTHPTLFINAANMNQFVEFVDVVKPQVLDYYHYHWYSKNHPERYYHYLRAFRDLAYKNGIPQMRALGSNNPPERIRQSMYVAAAYGVQAFHFWPPHFIGCAMDPGRNAILEDGKPVFSIAEHAKAISECALEFRVLGPTLLKLKNVAVYHTDKTLPIGAESAPADSWIQPEGETFLVSILHDDDKNRYLMPVNHAVDKARDLTIRFKENVALELLDRRSATWRPVQLDRSGGHLSMRMTLAPGDGELLRVLPGR